MPKVLITDGFASEAETLLNNSTLEVDCRSKTEREDFLNLIKDCDALVVRSATKVDAEALEAAGDRLEIIVRAGAGVDNIDCAIAKEKDIRVMNVPGANNNAVAELVLGYMFCLSRMISEADTSMTTGKWEKSKFKGIEIEGRTLGVLGLGKIGRIVAEKAVGLKMKVEAYDPFVTDSGHPDIFVLETMKAVAKRADFLTLHVPLMDETRNLVSDEFIATMKDGAFLINAARGGIVDESALLRALESGKLSGAAIDVWSEEPPGADNNVIKSLVNHPGVISTPHIAASTAEAQLNCSMGAANQILDYFRDGTLKNVVNP